MNNVVLLKLKYIDLWSPSSMREALTQKAQTMKREEHYELLVSVNSPEEFCEALSGR